MSSFEEQYGFTEADWEACIKVLNQLKETPFENPDNQLFSTLVTKVVKAAKKGKSKELRTQTKKVALESVLAQNAQQGTSFYGDEHKGGEHHFTKVDIPKNCYACNSSYNEVHSFYHRLCPDCAGLNLNQRWREADLQGRKVIITGGRVKVGYATALKFLRMGAEVVVTTRFPASALENFKKEDDYEQWSLNLEVYGLDLRLIGQVESFIAHYTRNYGSLDILVNNAAQTIKYPTEYYAPIVEHERKLLVDFGNQKRLTANVHLGETKLLTQAEDLQNLELNRFGQPVDTREKNSWNSTLQEIDALELLEVNLINQISPFIMIKAFTPLFGKSRYKDGFIINVTSSEGQFSYGNKTIFHPHTNMTKAALNMMTRTSAKEYAERSIWMNSVDVGWISTGASEELREKQFERGYIPPLDSVDGAARIMHPIFDQLEGKAQYVGQLIKNYRVENW